VFRALNVPFTNPSALRCPGKARRAADRLFGLRHRAFITLGFAGGFRRSELMAINCDELAFVSEGLAAMVAYGSNPASCRRAHARLAQARWASAKAPCLVRSTRPVSLRNARDIFQAARHGREAWADSTLSAGERALI
jgi:hypothetical protein